MNKYLFYRFFRILFRENVDAQDQKKIGLLSYCHSIQDLFNYVFLYIRCENRKSHISKRNGHLDYMILTRMEFLILWNYQILLKMCPTVLKFIVKFKFLLKIICNQMYINHWEQDRMILICDFLIF